MSGNVGKEEVSGGESGPGWFVHILLACQCLILGVLAWLVFVLDEGPKNSPASRKVHSLGVILALVLGIWGWGGSEGPCRDL